MNVVKPRAAVLALTASIFLGAAGLLGADSGANHQTLLSRPVQLGSSGGNINDRSSVWCCSGTLGALVTDGTTQYILSNNHVLARTNAGVPGEKIIQPGLIDESPVCQQDQNDVVAALSLSVPISFRKGTTNTVDAAIAAVQPNKVGATILDIPALSSTPAAINQLIGVAVQKSGRTTGLTSGTVAAVNVTINVKYGSQCGGGRGTGTFTNQIRVTPGSFSDGGDSGSLIVTTGTLPHPVGLLFAGSSSDTFANPIGAVLTSLGVSIVGYSSSTAGRFDRWFAWLGGRQLTSVSVAHAQPLVHGVTAVSQQAAEHAKARHEAQLLGIPGVVGAGVGASDTVVGEAVVEVYVETSTPAVRGAVPAQVDGVAVKIVETGEVRARR